MSSVQHNPHAIPEDPRGIILTALSAPETGGIAPEDIFLVWIMSLPDDVDPAHAARDVDMLYSGLFEASADGRIAELRTLIRTAVNWPRAILCQGKRRRSALDGKAAPLH